MGEEEKDRWERKIRRRNEGMRTEERREQNINIEEI